MKKILINSPILSRSGYGEMARFALNVLKKHEDKFDIYLNVLNWGQTGFIFEENEEYNYITSLRIKTDSYIRQMNGNPQFDISLQITIPNEWKKMAPYNVGYTAGIETTTISPAWLEPSQAMDKIIVISEHAKKTFESTVFQDEQGQRFKVTTPIEVVHFPWKKIENAKIDLNLEYDFNFLTVNQWGPRKNIEGLVSAFIDEFRNDEVGLVIKTNKAADSISDRLVVENQLKQLIDSKGQKKCKVYLVHGCLTESEVHGLYTHPKIKAFVTATHGEGFGLPIFEAANEELPIIATDWSGHLDFLNAPDKNGELKSLFGKIDFELKPIQEQFVWPGVMEKGTSWAFPTETSVRSRMREVYKDITRFKSWSRKISEYNKEKFNKEKIEEDFFYSLGVFSKPKQLLPKPIDGLSFCIPTHGKRIEKTLLTINSIKKQDWNGLPYEIIICGDVENFKNVDGVTLIESANDAHGRRVAALRNKAAMKAKYDIVFCDDDIILSSDWLETTINYSSKNGWDVLSNKVYSPDGTRYWDRSSLSPHILVDYDHPSNDKALYQSSAFFLVRKHVFKEVKWDETKLVFADKEGQVPEDVQYSIDLLKKDYSFSFNKNSLVWHNDDSYTEFSFGNVSQTLKKDFLKKNMKMQFFLDEDSEFINLLQSLN
jgi:glycosyltransferase involved in cell wall biosynthesis